MPTPPGPSDTFTPNKNFDQPQVGGDNGTWGYLLNQDLTSIDTAFGGVTNLTDTGGTVVLTATQYLPPNLIVAGVLSSNLTYQLPLGIGGQWSVYNVTTGTGTVTIASLAGGATVTVPLNKRVLVIADGTSNGVALSSSVVETLPGGTSGELQYNNSGVFGGLAGSEVSSTPVTVTGVSATSSGTDFTFTGTFSTLPVIGSSITTTTFSVGTYNGTFPVVSATSTVIHATGVTAGAPASGGTVSYNSSSISANQLNCYALNSTTVTATGLTTTDGLNTSGVIAATAGGYTTTYPITRAGSAFDVDCSLSNVFTNTLNANITDANWNITNPHNGQTINIVFTQAATGGPYTILFPASFKFVNGIAGTMSTADSSVSILVATYIGSVWYCSFLANMQ